MQSVKKPKIAVTCGWRYEPEWLVDQMKENLAWADLFAIMDDRQRKELWINEHEYRLKTRQLAISMGADWIMVTSPDERWEDGAGDKIREAIRLAGNKPVMLQFPLREMYTPDSYRVDGIWGLKTRIRLYPIIEGQRYKTHRIQCSPFPVNGQGLPAYPIVEVPVNIYHLKMIEPQNRTERTRVFKQLDPRNEFQEIGYDYLDDMYGARFERIKGRRGYNPPYKKFIFKAI